MGLVIVPEPFADRMRAMFGQTGEEWVAALPAIVAECAARWQITLAPPFANLTFGYVAPALRADGTPAVLKICPPEVEFAPQAAALRFYAGQGAARLLESDDDLRAMLMERVLPGGTLEPMALSGLEGDAAATRIAAEVMLALWRPVPPELPPFPTLTRWSRALRDYHERFPAGAGPLPEALVARAIRAYTELASDGTPPVLLHGDLHHTNILANADSRQRSAWLAIDPKGIVGPPGFEVGTFLRNPLSVHTLADAPKMLARRVAILGEMLGLTRESIREWGIAFAMLSAAWGVEDGETDENALAVAAMLAALG